MKKVGVQALQSCVKKRTTRGPGKTKFLKEGGVEVNESNKVTISKTRVELESKKDEERRKRECDRSTMTGSDVRDSIAKAHKLIKQKLKAARFGRIM